MSQYQLLPELSDEEFAALKADIDNRGVMVPLEMDERGNLLDGHHRLRACRELGITDYPTIIRPGLSEAEKTEHILALNLDRRHLSQEQRRSLIAKVLKATPEASNREVARVMKVDHHTVASVREDLESTGEFPQLERTIGADGKARPARRPAVLADNERATEKALTALAEVNSDSLPSGISDFRRVERIARAEAPRPEAPPLPEGVFSVVYADPPWEYANSGLHGSAAQHYPTMPTTALCDMPIAERLADNAVCFLWVTIPLLVDGLAVLSAWGFSYKTNFVWVKDRETYGKLGFYCYGQHELLLLGTRGSCLPAEEGKVASVLQVAKREHSRKPEEVYALIEGMYPGAACVELFARTEREGWTAWGNEVGKW